VLQMVVNSYPPRRLACTVITPVTTCFSSVAAVLRTSEGSVSLDALLGHMIHRQDAAFVQQEYETLVATINRHLTAVLGEPVAIQNDTHPSVFAAVSGKRKLKLAEVEHDAMLTHQQDAVRAVNFEVNGRWCSSDCPHFTAARNTKVSLSNVHACMDDVSTVQDRSKSTAHVDFLCHHKLIPVVGGLVYWVTIVGLATVLFKPSYPQSTASCMPEVLWQCMLIALLFASLAGFYLVMNLKLVVRVEVSLSRRQWKVQKYLASPPLHLISVWRGMPLHTFIHRCTFVVAEGSTEDLMGCEV
jgi:hypothetical protein